MYNLRNLNPVEFEDLCRDIADKMFGKHIRSFATGRDGGIDLADDTLKFIIQCKHIENYSNLKSSLKKEVDKIVGRNFEDYYIFTSCDLTPNNIMEIVEQFSFLPFFDGSHVISAKDIDEFLSKEENFEIVRRNHKLWYCSNDFMRLLENNDVFLDSDVLISKIHEKYPLYVETTIYKKALDLLAENKSLLIVGNPGVGKSVLSEMLVLHYAEKGYKVKYTTSGEIVNIKKTISNGKEIILLDDFLGSNELELSNEKVRQTESLIAYVNNHSDKKIILNSRLSLLNQAKEKTQKIEDLVENLGDSIVVVNCDDMTKEDKAEILFNHLYFRNIGEQYFDAVRRNDYYKDIITHVNYNPRIIDYATKPKFISQLTPDEYVDFIIEKLDNPQDVWRDEFYHKFSKADRILAYVIYTLGDSNVKPKIASNAFSYAIRNEHDIDKTVNSFDVSLLHLTDSILTINNYNKMGSLSFINPSVSDYIIKEFEKNDELRTSFLDRAMYIEQIGKIFGKYSSEMKELVNTGKILNFKAYTYEIRLQFVDLVVGLNIRNDGIKEKFTECFRGLYYGKERLVSALPVVYNRSKILQQIFCDILISKSLIDFYDIRDFFTDFKSYETWLADLDYYHLARVFDAFKNHFIKQDEDAETFKEIIECFREYAYQILLDEACSNVDIQSIIKIEVQGSIDDDYKDGNKYYISYRVKEEIKNSIAESILAECEEQMEYLIDETDSLLNIDKRFNVKDLKDKIDEIEIDNEVDYEINNEIERLIEQKNASFDIDYEDDDVYDDENNIMEDDWSRVDRLFKK